MKAAVYAISLLLCIVLVLTECVWDVNRDLSKKDPVFLKKSKGHRFNLYKPNSTSIILASKEVLVAVCTGRNSIVSTNYSSVRLACVSGSTVKVDNDRVDITNVSCTKNIVASVQLLPSTDNVLNVGFATNYGMIGLYKVLYDFNKSTPRSARHILHGANLLGSFTSHGDRPNFKTDGVPTRVDWNTIYQKQHQRQVLAKHLESEKVDQYLNETTLSRGHLVPDADFYFHSWKIATYFYANAVPTWQSINAGNWLRIENVVRNKAKDSKDDLKIITGIEGVMSLGGEDLYLDGADVPVPKYIWKVVCDKSDKCIVFVVVNNSFVYDNVSLCEDLCRDNRQRSWEGWCFSSYNKFAKGKVMFCDVKDLVQKSEKFYDILMLQAKVYSTGILEY